VCKTKSILLRTVLLPRVGVGPEQDLRTMSLILTDAEPYNLFISRLLFYDDSGVVLP
jgi:hypothetical protein